MIQSFEEWLIDGCNLLHSLNPRGKKIKVSKDLLFARLAGFAAAANRKVLLVWDGNGPKGEWESSATPLFQVLYSGRVSADAFIERYVVQAGRTGRFTVVTNDVALSRMARGAGACVMRTADFLELMEASEKEGRDIVFQQKVRAHGFHRPFEKKL